MLPRTLYRYPFDEEGRETLTFIESISAMQELERQINRLCDCGWRWCDLRLSVIERHPTYVIYGIEHRDECVGTVIVMPHVAAHVATEPQSTFNGRTLLNKICGRLKPERP
jgi:hypothetical protein